MDEWDFTFKLKKSALDFDHFKEHTLTYSTVQKS